MIVVGVLVALPLPLIPKLPSRAYPTIIKPESGSLDDDDGSARETKMTLKVVSSGWRNAFCGEDYEQEETLNCIANPRTNENHAKTSR